MNPAPSQRENGISEVELPALQNQAELNTISTFSVTGRATGTALINKTSMSGIISGQSDATTCALAYLILT